MTYDEELRALSDAAFQGDFVAGQRLLGLFASLADDPHGAHSELVRHVAQCIGRLLEVKPIQGPIAEALCIKRPRGRPEDDGIRAKHVRVVLEYLSCRALGTTKEDAMLAAGERIGLSLDGVKDLIVRKKTRAEVDVFIEALLQLSKGQRQALLSQGEDIRDMFT